MKLILIIGLLLSQLSAHEYKNKVLKNVEGIILQEYKDCIISKKTKKGDCLAKRNKEIKDLIALDSKDSILMKKQNLKPKKKPTVVNIKTNAKIDECLAKSTSMDESRACMKLNKK